MRRVVAGYYGLCSFMDEQVGKVLNALEETGLAGETPVMYTSDHDDDLGARGRLAVDLCARRVPGQDHRLRVSCYGVHDRLVHGPAREHPGIGPEVAGIALVAADNFSARYDLDRVRGVFSRPAHALFGQSYVDRVLVLNDSKGGVATSWMLREIKARDMAPAALLLNRANPIMAQGAAFAGLALIDRFDVDITGAIRTGQRVVVRPGEGIVLVGPRDDDSPD